MTRFGHGDDELNLTGWEQAYAEGRPPQLPRRRPRTRGRAPVLEAPAGGSVAIGLLIAFLITASLSLALKDHPRTQQDQQRAAPHTEATTRATSQRQTASGARSGPPQNRQIATRPQPRTNERAYAQPVPPNHDRVSPAPPSVPRQGLLPPGWDWGHVSGEVPLRDYPAADARVLARMTPGTTAVVRRLSGINNTSWYSWYTVVLADGSAWGYACIAPRVDREWSPLPPHWRQATYVIPLPLDLRNPPGRIVPGTEVILRRLGNSNTYFVMSADGETFGYALVRADGFVPSF